MRGERDHAVGALDVRCPDVRRAVLGREGHHALAAPGALENGLDLVGVKVHHGNARLIKDAELALEVVLEIGVLNGRDVVAPNVEEACNCKVKAQDSVVLEGLARDLHVHVGKAGLAGVGEVTPEVRGLRRGVVALLALDAVEGLDGAHDAGTCVRLVAVKHGAEHVGHRRLALGAGDANDGEVVVGVAKGLGRGERHGAAQVRGDECGRSGGNVCQPGCAVPVAKVGHGALFERGGEIGWLEGGALAYKDVRGDNRARVAVDPRDGHSALLGGDVYRGGQQPLIVEELGKRCECSIHAAKYSRRDGNGLRWRAVAVGHLPCSVVHSLNMGDWRSG